MKTILWVIVAIVILGGGYWLWQGSQAPAEAPSTMMGTNDSMDQGNMGGSGTGTPQEPGSVSVDIGGSVSMAAPKMVTVTSSGDAFDPKTVTINKGDTVKFVSTGGDMWVASAQHPDHTAYSGTTRVQHCPDTAGAAFDQCAPGTSYSFTFQKAGTWKYHDHLNAGLFGTVIVQ